MRSTSVKLYSANCGGIPVEVEQRENIFRSTVRVPGTRLSQTFEGAWPLDTSVTEVLEGLYLTLRHQHAALLRRHVASVQERAEIRRLRDVARFLLPKRVWINLDLALSDARDDMMDAINTGALTPTAALNRLRWRYCVELTAVLLPAVMRVIGGILLLRKL